MSGFVVLLETSSEHVFEPRLTLGIRQFHLLLIFRVARGNENVVHADLLGPIQNSTIQKLEDNEFCRKVRQSIAPRPM